MTSRDLVLFFSALLTLAGSADAQMISTLLDETERAELIAVGTVVPREGDPTTFGFVRHAFAALRVVKGTLPAADVLLEGGRSGTYDPATGKRVDGGYRSHSVEWREGELVLVFLRRVDNTETWRAGFYGVRRVPPGDYPAFEERITTALEILRRPEGPETTALLRAWVISLLDHEATLQDGVGMLLLSHHEMGAGPPLGELSAEQQSQLVRATELYAERVGWSHSPLLPAMLHLTADLPSQRIDSGLPFLVRFSKATYPGQHAEYAKLLAERLNDDELRELAVALEAHTESRDKRSDDPALRGAWEIEMEQRCREIHERAMSKLPRAVQ